VIYDIKKLKTGLLFGFLFILLSCATAWSDPILNPFIGDIFLNNVFAPQNGQPGGDNLSILNPTGLRPERVV